MRKISGGGDANKSRPLNKTPEMEEDGEEDNLVKEIKQRDG